MNKKQLSYIEIIKKIDEVFPLVSKFDYTKISPEELWDKLYDALDEIGLIDRLDEGELDELRKHITFQQQYVYGRTYTVHSNVASSREHGFNQKNYFINNNVMQMREEVFELLEEKHMIRFVSPGIRHYQGEDLIEEYSDNMGSTDEVREYIEPESIEDYIKELFDFTKEDNDNFNVDVLLLYRTIMHHYGFNADVGDLDFSGKFEEAILAASNPVYLNGVLDGTTLNESRFREKIVEVIKELIRFVKKSTKYSFERREELNERKKIKPNTDSNSQTSSIEKIQQELAGLKAALNDLRQQSYGGMEEPVEEDTYGDEGSSFKPGS